MSDTQTDIETRTRILGELFIDYKGDDKFSDFFLYNDLGLPLAYAIDSDIVKTSAQAELLINETFDLLLEALSHEEDTGFYSMAHIIGI